MLRPAKMVDLIEIFRRNGIGVEQSLLVCEADSRGRGAPRGDTPYPERGLVALCDQAMTASLRAGNITKFTPETVRQAYVRGVRSVLCTCR